MSSDYEYSDEDGDIYDEEDDMNTQEDGEHAHWGRSSPERLTNSGCRIRAVR